MLVLYLLPPDLHITKRDDDHLSFLDKGCYCATFVKPLIFVFVEPKFGR